MQSLDTTQYRTAVGVRHGSAKGAVRTTNRTSNRLAPHSVLRVLLGSAKGAVRTTNRTSNRLAPHSVLRVLLGSWPRTYCGAPRRSQNPLAPPSARDPGHARPVTPLSSALAAPKRSPARPLVLAEREGTHMASPHLAHSQPYPNGLVSKGVKTCLY